MQIQKDIMEELKWEPFLHASEIGVSVKHGIATMIERLINKERNKE